MHHGDTEYTETLERKITAEDAEDAEKEGFVVGGITTSDREFLCP
jgi:hypothetical protein